MNSKLQIDTVINSYPHEMVSSGGDMQGIYQAMIDNGIISPLVINVQKRNGQQVRLVRKNYYQPYSGLYTVKSIDVQAKSSDPIETRLNYLKHNQQLKVQSLAQTGGSKTTYLWSYNNEYPIAEIHNADYNIIESILGQASIDFWGNKDNPTSTELAVFLAPLRTASLLKDAHIITYTYKPLVGIASMTDAKGLTTTYEYDDFQRLKCVKDHNGNIVKLYDYQYQAPITQ